MEYGGGTSAECDYILHRTVIPCMGSHAGIFRTKFTSWRTNIFLRFILYILLSTSISISI